MTTAEEILALVDIETQDVEVPEWNRTIKVRGLSGEQRDAYESSCVEQRGKNHVANMKNVRAKLVALSVIDEDGKRMFTDQQVSDLGRKSARALDRLFSVAQKLSGLSSEDVEELAKN